MSNSVIYLFVDTNLLIQCLPLEELDWSIWNSFNEVRLIVSAPVLREIDYRKNKGNDRIGRRARVASAMFREIMNDEYKLVRDSDPSVKLSIEPQHQISKGLKNRLDYLERDDQLIGTIYEFAECNPGSEVHLLTHDTTPIYTAKSLGINVDVIPDNWLLPPENTKAEKELTTLKKENDRLKNAEPSFVIRHLSSDDVEIGLYEFSHTRFLSLTNAQVEDLMQLLKDRFSIETDFGLRETDQRKSKLPHFDIPDTKEEFVPATDKDIAKYCDETYPRWLEQCENMIRNYHQILQRKIPIPTFVFLVKNCGTRPAVDSLITIEAKGNFKINPPSEEGRKDHVKDDESQGRLTDCATQLPHPPIAPRGKWRKIFGGRTQSDLSTIDKLNLSVFDYSNMGSITRGLSDFDPPILHSPILPITHDPNTFYYKPNRPLMPQKSFSLECDQWRHEDGEVSFKGEFYLPPDQNKISGALACRIQAGNLSKTASKLIPVKVLISQFSAFEQAKDLVNMLTECSGLQFKGK